MTDARLFHLFVPGDLAAARRESRDAWCPASLETEGFVHLSFAHQIARTLSVHFSSAERLFLAEVDRVEDALRVEAPRGDEAFPHVHRPLFWDELVRWWTLARDSDGAWRVPRFGATPAGDDPAGASAPPK